jgi:hypothetical protein
MRMTRADMRSELQATGFGNTTADVIRQNRWLDTAYLWVWNSRDQAGAPVKWSFQQADQVALVVVGSDSTPVMPSDFGQAGWIMDDQGTELLEMEAEQFDRTFQPGVDTGDTAERPYAFKSVNGQVTFGPTPSAGATYTTSYRRRVSHYNAAGSVVGGTFTDDGDYPLWPDHHLVVVYHAALIGNAMRSNPFAQTFQALRDDALQQMRNDLEADWAPAQTWGDGGWQDTGGYRNT